MHFNIPFGPQDLCSRISRLTRQPRIPFWWLVLYNKATSR